MPRPERGGYDQFVQRGWPECASVELALWVKIDKDAGWVTGPAARCALCYLFTGAADVIMIGIFGQQRRRETQLTAPG